MGRFFGIFAAFTRSSHKKRPDPGKNAGIILRRAGICVQFNMINNERYE
jgi:hypothetical protein